MDILRCKFRLFKLNLDTAYFAVGLVEQLQGKTPSPPFGSFPCIQDLVQELGPTGRDIVNWPGVFSAASKCRAAACQETSSALVLNTTLTMAAVRSALPRPTAEQPLTYSQCSRSSPSPRARSSAGSISSPRIPTFAASASMPKPSSRGRLPRGSSAKKRRARPPQSCWR